MSRASLAGLAIGMMLLGAETAFAQSPADANCVGDLSNLIVVAGPNAIAINGERIRNLP